MSEHLHNTIICDFENSFRTNCLILIGEAYKWLNENKNVTVDWNEETISANILTYIDDSEKAISWNISIADECRLFNQTILNNKKSAKSAPRIDLKLTINWIDKKKRICFFVEAKNLFENNCLRNCNKTRLMSKKNHQRYISSGIDNFAKERYPHNGCILGYVLEGGINSIVEKINLCLKDADRSDEQLHIILSKIPFLEWCYTSKHSEWIVINHYFLDFTQKK